MFKKSFVNLLILLMLVSLLLPLGHSAPLQAAPSDYDCAAATGLPQAECEALVALYNATGGDNWANKTDWLMTTTPCAWYGITCASEHVTRISLPYGKLSGALPSEIGSFVNLQRLNLGYNALIALPPEIGDLAGLRELDLADNNLTALPSEIGSLVELTQLDLSANALLALPPEIGDLASLRWLDLPDNNLTTLPSEIGNLAGLLELDLADNNLTALPSEIGSLVELTQLNLSDNALVALPPEIGALTELTTLYLYDNALVALPPEIGNFTKLDMLLLSNNNLTTLPPEIGNLSELYTLLLHRNPLDGEMPAFLTSLTELGSFSFFGTGWCVPATGPVPVWLDGVWGATGTGLICGQPPAGLSGAVTFPDAVPAAGAQVIVYQEVPGMDDWDLVTTTLTTATGAYRFDHLGQGIDYRVQFVAPTQNYLSEYYNHQFTFDQATPVRLTLGMTRTGINALLDPVAVQWVKSASSTTIVNGGLLTYTLSISTNTDITLHLYDPLGDHLTWQGFVGGAPDTLSYADGALTGTVALASMTPLFVSFVARVNVPEGSFVNNYAQVANIAYYYFLDETLMLDRPSNTVVTRVRNAPFFSIFLPIVLRSS